MKSLHHSELYQESCSYIPILKKCILRNFSYYNFCWRLSFQPLEEDWATSGLFNILNGINIGNLRPIYSAIRALFLKLYFAKFRILQLLLNTWFSAVRGGLGNFRATYILNGINIENPLPMAYLKIVFCKISHFTAFARDLIFSF